jgi:hypothetical protein
MVPPFLELEGRRIQVAPITHDGPCRHHPSHAPSPSGNVPTQSRTDVCLTSGKTVYLTMTVDEVDAYLLPKGEL